MEFLKLPTIALNCWKDGFALAHHLAARCPPTVDGFLLAFAGAVVWFAFGEPGLEAQICFEKLAEVVRFQWGGSRIDQLWFVVVTLIIVVGTWRRRLGSSRPWNVAIVGR